MYFEVTAFIYICWRQALSCYKADFFSKVVPLPGWIKSNSRKIDCLHSYFFFSGLRFVSHGSRLRRSRAVTLQRKTRDCLQCTGKKLAELWQDRQGRTRPKLCGLCTYQCKSRGGGGGGGSAGKRRGFDAWDYPLVGLLIVRSDPGVRTFDFDRQKPGTNSEVVTKSTELNNVCACA